MSYCERASPGEALVCFACAHTQFYFTVSRAKRLNASSRSYGHTLPAQGKETSSESGKSLSVTALQRRLSCTSSCVFITTAVCVTYANMRTNVHDHSCVFLAFYSSSNSKTAAVCDRRPVKDSCWVACCSGKTSIPAILDPGQEHTWLACASRWLLRVCLGYESHVLLLVYGRCNNLVILILVLRIVLLLQCSCILICFYNSKVFVW